MMLQMLFHMLFCPNKDETPGERWILATFTNLWGMKNGQMQRSGIVMAYISLTPAFTSFHLPLFIPDCGPVC